MNRYALKWSLGSWVALRTVSSLAAWYSSAAWRVGPIAKPAGYLAPEMTGAGSILAGPWLRQDALWYLKIATQGYEKGPSLAFYPAFPLLTGLVTKLTENELVAGLLVASAACLVGFYMLFCLVERLLGRPAAKAAVAGLAVLPTAFFLVAPYAEPVLLAAGAGALLAAASGRTWRAFFAGAVAGVSRPFGVFVFLPIAALAWKAGGARSSKALAAAAGPLVGWAAWIAFSAVVGENPFAAFGVQAVWQRQPSFFPATLVNGFIYWTKAMGSGFENYFLLDLASVLFGISLIPATAVVFRKFGSEKDNPGRDALRPRINPSYAPWALMAYGMAVLLAPLSSPFPPRPLMSMPRFVLALFPLFGALGLIHHRLRVPLALLSAGGLFVASAVYVASRPLF